MAPPIEPKIKPLVDAINQTKICHTFSSCQGHFRDDEQKFQDRNKADVRFEPLDGISLDKIEHFITYLMTEFVHRYTFSPVQLVGYKLYTPDLSDAPNPNYMPDYVFVIELEPFDRFDIPNKKRRDIDRAILQTTEIVKKYNK